MSIKIDDEKILYIIVVALSFSSFMVGYFLYLFFVDTVREGIQHRRDLDDTKSYSYDNINKNKKEYNLITNSIRGDDIYV